MGCKVAIAGEHYLYITTQELAGHTSLAMTQRYIEGDTEAKRKLVALL
jgi:integrase